MILVCNLEMEANWETFCPREEFDSKLLGFPRKKGNKSVIPGKKHVLITHGLKRLRSVRLCAWFSSSLDLSLLVSANGSGV
jgi:hypothetical protein